MRVYNHSPHYPVAAAAVGSQVFVIEFFKTFVDIALWRKGPQHLPSSVLLLLIVVSLDAVLTFLFTRAIAPTEKQVALQVVLRALAGLGWLWALLALFRRPERFVQTANAIFGVSVLLSPLVLGMKGVVDIVGSAHPLTVPMRLGLLTVVVWYLLVNAHIMRAALEVGLFVAILLTLLGTGCIDLLVSRVVALATRTA